jgi:Heterokaryon incompatibility protein (HET)
MAARTLCSLTARAILFAVECDGQKVWITTSLHSASQRIRGITSPATMWIDVLCTSLRVDTLCINQSSKTDALRERQHQVQIMARVFGSTRTVIGDLGKRPKYFDEMLKLFLHSYSSAQGKVEGFQGRVGSD